MVGCDLQENIICDYIKDKNLDSLLHYTSLNGIHISSDVSPSGTLMHFAAMYNNAEIMEELLKRGASVDNKNVFGWTPLMMAARNKCYEAVELLVNAGADIICKNFHGTDALFLASAGGSVRIVHVLLCEGALNSAESGSLISPLMIASFNGHFEVITELSLACCINQFNSKLGMTSLMCASAQGHERIVHYLISKEAKIDMKNKAGFSALDISSLFQYQFLGEILKLNMNKTRKGYLGNFNIIEELKNGEIDLVRRIILEDPARAKITSEDGVTPLAIAAELGFDCVARLLVECGANIDAQSSKNQRTPLMESVDHNNRSIANFLLRSGANVNLKDEYGRKAIDFAYDKAAPELISRITFFEVVDYQIIFSIDICEIC